ncbi:hypothetical protein DICPUDRAFT_75432 [Dictyostelium purpureum]|uniref:Uncharacterized protein n=1 Tax=Dictyostelium purpureum TaxID=5786 RepID=F0ZAN2_DICPU|nr:uncharacterized protein DICPUDRAFT_75432 [Dictyostelium purpureum]EGC39027.1 hypothetical protein DICPUDRAFT_75432 [Dictyostelium purpureum]|eukprot:XP_003284480.1 hypothetical protein DICPUDRAFT_75432 [Dictyostelium purpureum]
MDDLFLRVFKNKYLNSIIFGFIKQSNKELLYFTYNYYTIPLTVIIKNNDKELLIEKIKLHGKYFNKNSNFLNQNNKEIYKYYFDIDPLDILVEWDGFDIDLLKLLDNNYPNQLKFTTNHLHTISKRSNITLLKEIEKRIFHSKINKKISWNWNLDFDLSKKSNDIIEVYKFIKNNYLVKKLENRLILLLSYISKKNKSNELGCFFLNELVSVSYNKDISLNNKTYERVFLNSLELKDLEMIKILFSIVSENNTTIKEDISEADYVSIMGYKLLKKQFSRISGRFLIKSKLVELFKEVYPICNRSDQSFCGCCGYNFCDSMEIAEYMFQNGLSTKATIFSVNCVRDDLSNLHLFEKVEMGVPSNITIEKFNLLIKHFKKFGPHNYKNRQFCKIYFTKNAFYGDIDFFKKFTSEHGRADVNLKSALEFGYNDILNYALDNIENIKQRDLYSLLLSTDDEIIIEKIKGLLNFNEKSEYDSKIIFESSFKNATNREVRAQLINRAKRFPGLLEWFFNTVLTPSTNNSLELFLNIGINPTTLCRTNINDPATIKSSDLSNHIIEFLLSNKLRMKFIKSLIIVLTRLPTKPKIKTLLFLMDINIITIDFTSTLVKNSVMSSNAQIIDLLLNKGNFTNLNIFKLKDNDLLNYIKEVHYLIKHFTLKKKKNENYRNIFMYP